MAEKEIILMQVFGLTKDEWELISSAIGVPLLIVGASFALYQLYLLNKQNKINLQQIAINSKRESIKLAVEQCNYYAESILADSQIATRLISEKKLITFNPSDFKVSNKRITFSCNEELVQKDIDKCNENEVFINLLNKLESLSIFFVGEIADDDIAYSAIGRSYIRQVKRFAPLIYRSGSNDNITHYININKLFLHWYERFEEEEKSLNYTESVSNTKLSKIKKPIGTEQID